MFVARLQAFNIIASPASAMPSSYAHSWCTCSFPRARTKPSTRDRSWELFRVASTFAGAVALVNFGLSLWLVMFFGLPFTHLHVMMLPLVQAVSWIYHHCNVVEVTHADAHQNYGSHVVDCNICIGLLQCHPIHVVFVCKLRVMPMSRVEILLNYGRCSVCCLARATVGEQVQPASWWAKWPNQPSFEWRWWWWWWCTSWLFTGE